MRFIPTRLCQYRAKTRIHMYTWPHIHTHTHTHTHTHMMSKLLGGIIHGDIIIYYAWVFDPSSS